jgi:hypothetical protein
MRTQVLPAMPEIGHPERFYAHRVRSADRIHDIHTHAAYKVGQYITLALGPHLLWPQRLKYFQHALRRHCEPPLLPNDEIWMFYRQLADLVRTYAGQEALKVLSFEDDQYAKRLQLGQLREKICAEAESFFLGFIPSETCPDWFHEEDYASMKLLRDQWV